MEQASSESLNLAQALGVVRRRAPLIVLCVIVVAGAAYAFTSRQTKEYTATASVVFSSDPLSEQVAGLAPATSTNQFVQQASNVQLVALGSAAPRTARLLGHGLTPRQVRQSISVTGQGESNVIAVSATSTSPKLAAAIATTYARQFVRQQQGGNRKFFASALALVEKQLDKLPADQRYGPAAVALQNRAQTLRLLQSLHYDNVYVAQAATVPAAPSSPHVSKNTAIGVVLGLFLGLALAFVLERLHRDRRIMDPDDLEASFGLALLGTIPQSTGLARLGRKGGGEAGAAASRAFDLTRARLRLTDPGRELRTVLLTSPGRDEGTTTVARCLAEAAARTGSRALLLETDLRQPGLAGELPLSPSVGLPEVLNGATTIQEAVRPIDGTRPGSARPGSSIDLLACGPTLPPNPVQLLESSAMEALLDYVRSAYDLVVIDAPPLTVAPDAYPLLRKVDGVVVVSWVGRTRRASARRLREILATSKARQLGLIANGVRARRRGGEGYTPDEVLVSAGTPSPAAGGSRAGAPVPATEG